MSKSDVDWNAEPCPHFDENMRRRKGECGLCKSMRIIELEQANREAAKRIADLEAEIFRVCQQFTEADSERVKFKAEIARLKSNNPPTRT